MSDRIRLLIAEMADQREAIVTSGTRVRDAIATAHDGIAADLNSAGASLSERLTETGQRLTASIGAASDDVARRPGGRRVDDAGANRR